MKTSLVTARAVTGTDGRAPVLLLSLAVLAPRLIAPGVAAAAASAYERGDIAWMLVSTLLVLMMAIPGLALFYGGMVRAKRPVRLDAGLRHVQSAVGALGSLRNLYLMPS